MALRRPALDEAQLKLLFTACEQMLASNAWQSTHATRIDGLKKRLQMLPAAGLPRMRVVPNAVLERLGRIPRSTEGHQVDALEAVERKGPDRLNQPRTVFLVRPAVLSVNNSLSAPPPDPYSPYTHAYRCARMCCAVLLTLLGAAQLERGAQQGPAVGIAGAADGNGAGYSVWRPG